MLELEFITDSPHRPHSGTLMAVRRRLRNSCTHSSRQMRGPHKPLQRTFLLLVWHALIKWGGRGERERESIRRKERGEKGRERETGRISNIMMSKCHLVTASQFFCGFLLLLSTLCWSWSVG